MNSEGQSRPVVLFFIFIGIIVFYAALKTVPVYADYYLMKLEVENQVKDNDAQKDAVVNNLVNKAGSYLMPISGKNITVWRDKSTKSLSVDVRWVTTVDYTNGIVIEFPFTIQASGRAAAT